MSQTIQSCQSPLTSEGCLKPVLTWFSQFILYCWTAACTNNPIPGRIPPSHIPSEQCMPYMYISTLTTSLRWTNCKNNLPSHFLPTCLPQMGTWRKAHSRLYFPCFYLQQQDSSSRKQYPLFFPGCQIDSGCWVSRGQGRLWWCCTPARLHRQNHIPQVLPQWFPLTSSPADCERWDQCCQSLYKEIYIIINNPLYINITEFY